jgi:hypothetical protein
MRDLLFRNLTSEDKKRKVIASSEVADREGVHSVIHRHFVCMMKEVKDASTVQRPDPYLYVLKESNTKDGRQKFFCRIKGSIFAVAQDKIYLVSYMHSLKICLSSLPNNESVR